MMKPCLWPSYLTYTLNQLKIKKRLLSLIFLNLLKKKYTALYILGDFFEYWVGDDDNELVNLEIKRQLKTATKNNLKIFFLHGNRDFLIGQNLRRRLACKFSKMRH